MKDILQNILQGLNAGSLKGEWDNQRGGIKGTFNDHTWVLRRKDDQFSLEIEGSDAKMTLDELPSPIQSLFLLLESRWGDFTEHKLTELRVKEARTPQIPREQKEKEEFANITPAPKDQKIVLTHTVASLDEYIQEANGFEALTKALKMSPDEIIEEIRRSGLRGRGGAGFPTGIKWRALKSHPCPRKFVLCNAAEGEPGTYKDRWIIQHNPYQVIEGIAIASYVINAERAFLCIKKKFKEEVEILRRVLTECYRRGYIGENAMGSGKDLWIDIVLGPDSYLYGEEKGLIKVVEAPDSYLTWGENGELEVILGGREPAWPEMLPPYQYGPFAGISPGETNPSIVNNLETLCNIPHIIRNGARWFRSFGTADTPGTMVFTLSGDVQRPGVYELHMGTTLRSLIYDHGGGMLESLTGDGKGARFKLKAVFPGLVGALLREEQLDTPLDFGSMQAVGAGLGSGGFIVYDETACMHKVSLNLSRFLALESCGQCHSCKQGTETITQLLTRLESIDDYFEALNLCESVPSGARCYLPSSEQKVIRSILLNFPEDFEDHIGLGEKLCTMFRDIPLPKISSAPKEEGGRFIYDTDYWEFRPKWWGYDEAVTRQPV